MKYLLNYTLFIGIGWNIVLYIERQKLIESSVQIV